MSAGIDPICPFHQESSIFSQKSPEDFPFYSIGQNWITGPSLGAGEDGKVGTGLSGFCAWSSEHSLLSDKSLGSVRREEGGKGH